MSLTRAVSRWLRNKPSGSITTWEDLKTKFLSKYCPPTRTAKKIEEINNFQQEQDENLYQAWERFKELLMKCPQHYLTEIQEVVLFYNGFDVPTRQILDSRGAIPSKTATNEKVAIQEMAEYSQKWHNGTSRTRSIGKFVFPVDFIILDMPEDIKVSLILRRPFCLPPMLRLMFFKRKITLRVGEEKIIFKSVKPTRSLINMVYMLSLRERMELDLEARLMGETLVLKLDHFFEDYIELTDLNAPLKLRRDQVDDLMPTIEEGDVVEEFSARNDARMVSKFFGYPSDCDYDNKIRIDCAYNLKFSCVIVFEFLHANFFPILYVNIMSKRFHNSIMRDKMEYKENNVVGALMNIHVFIGTFSILTDFAVLEDVDAYYDDGMGDVIFGKLFLREVRINAKRFEGMITIHNGNKEVTYQMARSHPRFKHHTNKQCNEIPPLLKDLAERKEIDDVGGETTIRKIRNVGVLKLQDGWEVIKNGNAPPITQVVKGVETIIAPATAEEKGTKKAVEKRFGGNAATKKTQRNLLKHQYENFTASSSEVLDQTFDRLQKLIRIEFIHHALSNFAKIFNEEGQLQALVDGKKIIITKSTIRKDLQLEDVEGVDCLSNAVIFEQLTVMSLHEVTAVKVRVNAANLNLVLLSSANPTDLHHTPTMTQPSTSQPQKTKHHRKLRRKVTKVPQPSDPTSIADEAVNKEMSDSLERAATTTTSLDAEQDKGSISKTQSKATSNELGSQGTGSVVVLARVKSSVDEGLGEEDTSKQWRIVNIDANKDITLKMFNRAFKKVNTFVDYITELVEESSKKHKANVTKGSSKRAGTELEQENVKKQKIDNDKETTELQQLVKIIPNEEGVAIDVIPLAVKPPSIVD
nr:hypothetical protein [Tanacetum cinerariifolium]